jgi:ubiquinone/menaquinone biosynthesis C-methylase UbiE
MQNADQKTVEGFGDEWQRFDQSALTDEEVSRLWNTYFDIFPWPVLPPSPVGFDLGCGSGRWAKLVAPRVGMLHCIDPSEALAVARKNLVAQPNCSFHTASVAEIPLADASMDFGYSLGVLHHVPDTQAAIASCVKKLKPGAPLLLYLYYAFDNKPLWFRTLWRASDIVRRIVSRCPLWLRYHLSQIIAAVIYWPLARFAALAERLGINTSNFPLTFYKSTSFYVMRTDALDRFGTRLEQRFTKHEIEGMMKSAGLERVVFSNRMPYWCAMGFRCTP